MYGLIYKDLLTTYKKHSKIDVFVNLGVLAALLALLRGMGAIIASCSFCPVMVSAILLTLTIADEECSWDRFALTLPLGKRRIVTGRYCFCGLAVAGCFLFAVALNLAAALLWREASLGVHLGFCLLGLGISILFASLLIPASYRFGQNGSALVLLLMLVFAVGVAVLLGKLGVDILAPTAAQLAWIAAVSAVLLAAGVYASLRLSIAIYSKKHS